MGGICRLHRKQLQSLLVIPRDAGNSIADASFEKRRYQVGSDGGNSIVNALKKSDVIMVAVMGEPRSWMLP